NSPCKARAKAITGAAGGRRRSIPFLENVNAVFVTVVATAAEIFVAKVFHMPLSRRRRWRLAAVFGIARLANTVRGIAKYTIVAVYSPRDVVLVIEASIGAVCHIFRAAKIAALPFVGTESVAGRWTATAIL